MVILYFCKSFLYELLSEINRISEQMMYWYSSKFFMIPDELPILGNNTRCDFVFIHIPSKSPSTLSMIRSCVVTPSLDNNLRHFISLIIYLLIIIWYTFTINTGETYPFKNLTYS